MQAEIVITGIGAVSSIGLTANECYNSLAAGRCGIGSSSVFKSSRIAGFPAGEIRHTNGGLAEIMGLPASAANEHSRTSLLACIAAAEAADSAGLKDAGLLGRAGLISGTTVGGMDITEKMYSQPGISPASYLFRHPCGHSTDMAADYIGAGGYRSTLSTACSSAANAVIFGAMMLLAGKASCVIAGGTDALSEFTASGFNSLMILDRELCRPFCDSRRGLNLGEGAGYIVMERRADAEKRGAPILCRLAGWANTNDAYHQTASSPEGNGAYAAMLGAMQMAGLGSSDISYINAHGTGTENNDLSEGTAMKRIFGGTMPPFSSTKSFTGHTLAAAAGVEAVFSVLSIARNSIFPNLRFNKSIEGLGLAPAAEFSSSNKIDAVLSNSFGFGGNNSSLLFSSLG
jgi:3-oxoacyl-(acyl-carrier-protein) synthase